MIKVLIPNSSLIQSVTKSEDLKLRSATTSLRRLFAKPAHFARTALEAVDYRMKLFGAKDKKVESPVWIAQFSAENAFC